jgi:hypothetical protein
LTATTPSAGKTSETRSGQEYPDFRHQRGIGDADQNQADDFHRQLIIATFSPPDG